MKKLLILMLMAVAGVAMAEGTVVVKSVTAQQRYPWNGLVDIVVTMEGAADDMAITKCTFAATNSATGEAVPITIVTRKGSDTGSGITWTRRFIWNAANDVGAVKINDLALTIDVGIDGVQLWENGPYWAECNIGAAKPEVYGYYFWWGDTVGYKRNAANNGWISVKDGATYSFIDCPTYRMNNSQLQSAGYIDSTGNLVAAHDAATAHLGAPWRMPTDAEFSELISNYDTTWATRNGVSGRLVTGRGAYASKSIFLPAAGYGYTSFLHYTGSDGYYWSATPYSDYSGYVWPLRFDSSDFGRYISDCYYGQPVRPLRGFASGMTGSVSSQTIGVGVTTNLKLDCRTGTRVCTATGETLRYDASWHENGDSVRITDNGVVVHTGVAGSYPWMPESAGLHTLKLETLSNGQVVATETAEFAYGVVVKAVSAQQRYPWNGLVDIVVTMQGSADDVAAVECSFVATNSATGAAVPVTTVTRKGSDTGSGAMWTRQFIWNAINDIGAVKIDGLAITANVKVSGAKVFGGIQLWEDGPYWAECNVGATKPEDYGYYFWWGDTVGYKRNADDDSLISVKDGASYPGYSPDSFPTYTKSNSQLQAEGYIDSTGNLVAAHDAATAHLGAPWRMPTAGEIDALSSNCDTTWTTCGDVYGCLVTGRGAYASKSIFLPAAGYYYDSAHNVTGSSGNYWTSTPCSDYSAYAWRLSFNPYGNSFGFGRDYYFRIYGQSVRPLRGFANSASSGVASGEGVTTKLNLDCRTEPRYCKSDGEVLRYDASWHENGDSVRITDNGVVVHTGVVGSYTWQPESAGFHTLKLETLSNGQVVATETAEFTYGGVVPPSWDPIAQEDTMVVYAVVSNKREKVKIEAEGSRLAAFDKNGECRGVTEVENGPFGAFYQLTVGIESTGEQGFVLKVWDAASEAVYDIAETFDANADKQIGQIFEPVVYTTRTAPDDPIPEIVDLTPEKIAEVLTEAEDPKLAENVTNEADYAAFRAWSGIVKPAGGGETSAGAADVMAAPNAWMSYALGSETLLEAAPTDEDLTVEAFEPKSGESGKFDFTVSVKDVEVGGAAQTEAQREQVKENLKQVFGLEGTTSLDDGTKPFSSGNVDITFGVPEDGKVKFTAGPKDAGAKTFFMKVRVK